MKQPVLFFLFLVVGYQSYSQDFILEKRPRIKNKMEKYYAANNRKYIYSETGNSATFILNDSLSLPATTVFYFNNNNRCIKQEIIFTCDSCLDQSMQQSLQNKFIRWNKTGPDTYYAGFPYNALMEQVKTNGQFILRYTWLKRKDLKTKTA